MLGYVYVLQNPAMPGLLKIGGTAKTVTERAQELASATGVPAPFRVTYYQAVSNWRAAEREIHARLKQHRENDRREFFKLEAEAAADIVQKVAAQYPASETHGMTVIRGSNATASLVGVVNGDHRVYIDTVWWDVPPDELWHINARHRAGAYGPTSDHVKDILNLEFAKPVDAQLERNRDAELTADLERRLGQAERRAELAHEQWEKLHDSWNPFKKDATFRALESSCERDAEVTGLREQLNRIQSGSSRWKREAKAGYWYYEHKIYSVEGLHLLPEECAIVVQHFAETQRSTFERLALEAEQLRAKRK